MIRIQAEFPNKYVRRDFKVINFCFSRTCVPYDLAGTGNTFYLSAIDEYLGMLWIR